MPPLEKTQLAQSIEAALPEVELYGEREVRWYQIAARNGVTEALRDKVKRILVVMPTGAGKTLTSGLIFSSPEIHALVGATGRKLRLLFIAHKHRLLTQAETEYADANNVEFIQQSAFSKIPQEVLDEGVDLVCIDEAHHEAMMTIQYQLEIIGDFPIIGLTATPDRADGMLIKFERIIEPISREQAVSEGFLAPTYLNSFIDTPKRNKTDVVIDILNHFGHEMSQTMIFVRTKKEVAAVAEHIAKLGYTVIPILNQNDAQLDELLNAFSAGNVQFLVNCNRINEGVDTIGCTDVFLGRQFGSYPQLNQVIGRAARPDSDCNVWELVDPLSGRNLDTTVVVGTPERHRLISKRRGNWRECEFDYTSTQASFTSGSALQYRIG
jgi:superfamily II DNA or RNA helicase